MREQQLLRGNSQESTLRVCPLPVLTGCFPYLPKLRDINRTGIRPATVAVMGVNGGDKVDHVGGSTA